MKIAVIGAKTPSTDNEGIDNHCYNLYKELVKRGNEVTFYCKRDLTDPDEKEIDGIKIIPVQSFQSKYIGALSFFFEAAVQALNSDAEIIHYHTQSSCLLSWISKIFANEKTHVYTCHNLQWKKSCWNWFDRNLLKTGEFLSGVIFDKYITVSKPMQAYYQSKYNVNVFKLNNGINEEKPLRAQIIKERYGLEKNGFILYCGEISSDKNLINLIKSYRKIKPEQKLVIAGFNEPESTFLLQLEEFSKNDAIIIQKTSKNERNELFSNAFLYINAQTFESMPLGLLKAMSFKTPCFASNTKTHLDIIDKSEKYGFLYNLKNPDDLSLKLEKVLTMPESTLQEKALAGYEKIKQDHIWANAAKKLEIIYKLN